MDLPVRRIHAHHYARQKAPPQSHCPLKRRAHSNASSASASGKERERERERPRIPQLPQLRALQQESQDTPLSESSLPSSARSGHRRAHPYGPAEDGVEGSSCELVPSLATKLHAHPVLTRVLM